MKLGKSSWFLALALPAVAFVPSSMLVSSRSLLARDVSAPPPPGLSAGDVSAPPPPGLSARDVSAPPPPGLAV